MELSGKKVYGPVLKTTQLSAHAQNHASPERCRKSFTMIAADFSSFIVEVAQNTTTLGILIPILRKLGAA